MAIRATFTEEAKNILEEEAESFRKELRSSSIDEALTARGEPIEVTATDVRRAKSRFARRETPLRPATELTLRLYGFLGGLMIAAGILYFFIKEFAFELERSSMISLIIALMGIILVALSFFGRSYFKYIHEQRIRRILREEGFRERDKEKR